MDTRTHPGRHTRRVDLGRRPEGHRRAGPPPGRGRRGRRTRARGQRGIPELPCGARGAGEEEPEATSERELDIAPGRARLKAVVTGTGSDRRRRSSDRPPASRERARPVTPERALEPRVWRTLRGEGQDGRAPTAENGAHSPKWDSLHEIAFCVPGNREWAGPRPGRDGRRGRGRRGGRGLRRRGGPSGAELRVAQPVGECPMGRG